MICAAKDKVDGREADGRIKSDLLAINVCALPSHEKGLPGYIGLYIGMPVVLRLSNVSTELRVANGSQGTVVHIETEVMADHLVFATCVLAFFPESPVQLSGLPRGVFPILPLDWKFNTSIIDESGLKRVISVSRSQIPLQPAFAVTGHFAQGKTLPKVLVDL
ncbi:hypothetical protein M407DRAFT_72803, partial [Tulasnella calospora MUT 4182]